MENYFSLMAFVVAAISLIVSIKAWHKGRAIYGVERSIIRQYHGDRGDLEISEDSLNDQLRSGNYLVLAVMERKSDHDWEVLMGRIKPYTKSGQSR